MALQMHRTIVLRNHPMHDREPESCTIAERRGGEEGFEGATQSHRIHTLTGVLYPQFDNAIMDRGGAERPDGQRRRLLGAIAGCQPARDPTQKNGRPLHDDIEPIEAAKEYVDDGDEEIARAGREYSILHPTLVRSMVRLSERTNRERQAVAGKRRDRTTQKKTGSL